MLDTFNTIGCVILVTGLQVEPFEFIEEGVEVWQWGDVAVCIDVPGLGHVRKVAGSITSLFRIFDIGEFNILPDTKYPCFDSSDGAVFTVEEGRFGGFGHFCTI